MDESLLRGRAPVSIIVVMAMAFLFLQLLRPRLPNPPVSAEWQVPEDVKQILTTACYNCHSNETKLSWFDYPVPAYWLVVRDVREGRKRLNFSEIGKLPKAQQQAALYESISQIELGAMPLPPYKRLHPDSRITPAQVAVLKNYLLTSVSKAPATPAEIAAADAQYNKWIASAGSAQTVSPAPNGIAFLPEYKDWKAISSTERFDNHTLRQILGNDMAVKAIAENKINPWPDGTAFAKIAWFQQADANGLVHPGAFYQVEFMIRDSQKYAATKGWGWARWRGADLKPYGKDSHFADECVGCHSPLEKTNYVFTKPIGGQP
jgi:Haem-binding domain/Cytochrome P460